MRTLKRILLGLGLLLIIVLIGAGVAGMIMVKRPFHEQNPN